MSFRYSIKSDDSVTFSKRVDEAVLRGDTLIKLHKSKGANLVNFGGHGLRYLESSNNNKRVAIMECRERE